MISSRNKKIAAQQVAYVNINIYITICYWFRLICEFRKRNDKIKIKF